MMKLIIEISEKPNPSVDPNGDFQFGQFEMYTEGDGTIAERLLAKGVAGALAIYTNVIQNLGSKLFVPPVRKTEEEHNGKD